jgi:hypothetical protein
MMTEEQKSQRQAERQADKEIFAEIRAIRKQIDKETKGMTTEERIAFINKEADEALASIQPKKRRKKVSA